MTTPSPRTSANLSHVIAVAALAILSSCAGSGRRIQVNTKDAPAAIGPYSQAIQVGHTLYLSGQIGLDPATGKMVKGGVEAETRRCLESIQAILEHRGFSLADVVQAQVFLADLNDYAAMNGVYSQFFTEAPPARAAVQVARVPRDALVEIMVTAVRQ